jgi:23S rRNA pseudouridine1911/1915/1917 synthase
MVVRADAPPAETRVRVLERRGDCALVRCTPITGRQHQIRAHLAAAGHPIVGDKLYAHGDEAFAAYCDRGLTAELLARFELPRQALHAASIRIPHPETGAPLAVDCPLPADLRAFLARRGA